MESYYYSKNVPSSSPNSYRGLGNERVQSKLSSGRNAQLPKSLRLNILDNDTHQNPDSLVHNGFLTARSSKIYSSPSDFKEEKSRLTADTTPQTRHTKIFDGTRGTLNQFPTTTTPNKDMGVPAFGSVLTKEKGVYNKQNPQTQDYFETAPRNTVGYDFDYTERFNNSWSQSMAYAGAMKALQIKIKNFEIQNGHIMQENQELKELVQLEAEKSGRLEQEVEEYKVIESRIREQLEVLENDSRYLAQTLEITQNERQVLEISLVKLKEENITLRDENGTTNRQNKDNSVFLQELLANEKNSQNDLKSSIEILKHEKEELVRKNEELLARCNEAEANLADTKKIYKEHLQELVLKNETMTRQLESCKDFYTNQINDFQRDLSNIEEVNNSKVKELEIEKQVFKDKIQDMEQMMRSKDREIEELKQNLGKFMNHVLENESVINKSVDYYRTSHAEAPLGLRSSKFPLNISPEERHNFDEQIRGSTPNTSGDAKKFHFRSVNYDSNDISDKFEGISPLSVQTTYWKNEPNFNSELFAGESPAFKSSMISKTQNEYGLEETLEGKYQNSNYQNKSRYPPRTNGGQQGGQSEHESFVLEKKDPRLVLSPDIKSQHEPASNYLTPTDNMGKNGQGSFRESVANQKYPEFNLQQNNLSNRVSSSLKNLHPMRGLSFGKEDSDNPSSTGYEKDRTFISRFKQDINQKYLEEESKPSENRLNGQDYLGIIENIVSTEKEIENLNKEYKQTLEKAKFNDNSKDDLLRLREGIQIMNKRLADYKFQEEKLQSYH